jgi:hypothetical protein
MRVFLAFLRFILYLCEKFREVTLSRHKKEFFLLFCSRFTVTLHLEKAVAASVLPKPKAQSYKSFGGRRKTFARPPQDIAPPAARLCHGRGKLVTLRFAPCYMPSKSLFHRGSSPFLP